MNKAPLNTPANACRELTSADGPLPVRSLKSRVTSVRESGKNPAVDTKSAVDIMKEFALCSVDKTQTKEAPGSISGVVAHSLP